MLDQLLNLVQENAQDTVVNNPAVPDEHNTGIMQEAVSSITDGLRKELSNGGFQNVLKTLGGHDGNPQENPVVNNISGDFMNNIMQKFGLNSQTAQSVASSLIPLVMGKLIHKTNDPNDSSFDLGSIFSNLTGGKTSGLNLNSILQSVTGSSLDKNADGKVDLNDITGMISGAVQGNAATPGQEQGSSGNIMGAIKGLFGGE